MNYVLIIIVVVLVGYVLFAARFKRFPFGSKVIGTVSADSIQKELKRLGIPQQIFAHSATTPQDVMVLSVVPVPVFALADIDEGLTNQITRHNAKYPHWDKYKNHSDYKVLLVNPMTTNVENEPGSPALILQGHLQTAGTCIGQGTDLTHIVAPHQQAQEWRFRDYFMRTIWHESEHIRESQNDKYVFQMYVGAGDVHPHVN